MREYHRKIVGSKHFPTVSVGVKFTLMKTRVTKSVLDLQISIYLIEYNRKDVVSQYVPTVSGGASVERSIKKEPKGRLITK